MKRRRKKILAFFISLAVAGSSSFLAYAEKEPLTSEIVPKENTGEKSGEADLTSSIDFLETGDVKVESAKDEQELEEKEEEVAEAKKEEENGKRKYRKKKVGTPRLCADDVMARNQLKNYQDSYAQLMNKYGLQRGIDGSEAKHISISEYYKSLIGATENLQSELQTLETNKGQLQSELKEVKRDIKMEKLKSSAVNATTAITDSVSSLFGSNKVKRLEEENKQLKADKTTLEGNISTLKKQMTTSEMVYKQQVETLKYKLAQYATNKQSEDKKLEELIPYLADIKAIVRECLQMGFATHLIRTISCFKKVSFSGSLYSKQHNRKFDTEQSVAYIKNVVRAERKNKWQLFIDELPVVDWFKMKYEQWKEKQNLMRQPTQHSGIRR